MEITTHLRQEERYTIQCMLEKAYPQVRIAEALGRDPGTISREIRRNTVSPGAAYRGETAHGMAGERRGAASARPKRGTPAVLRHIEAKLREEQWSPGQIGATMPRHLGGKLSHETVHAHVRRDRAAGGSLHRELRHRGKRKRKSVSQERRGKLSGATPLASRPAVVDRRGRYGDREVDLMECSDGYAVVCRERKSQVVRIGRVPRKEAPLVGWEVIGLLAGHRRHTLTWDRGLENAEHATVDEVLGCRSYFCEPYCSWQKPCVEHSNGLLRQYLPRKGALMSLTGAAFRNIEEKLNGRPRKLLGYRTPESLKRRHLVKRPTASVTRQH